MEQSLHSPFAPLRGRIKPDLSSKSAIVITRFIHDLFKVIDAHLRAYVSSDPHPDIVSDALATRVELQRFWATRRMLLELDMPLSATTTTTIACALWLACAQLGCFIYGLNAFKESTRRGALKSFSVVAARDRGLLLFNEDIMALSVHQLFLTLSLLRMRWRYMTIDKDVCDLMVLLEMRAGFFVCNAFPAMDPTSDLLVDMPSYRVCVEGKWITNELFLVHMEVFFWAMASRVIISSFYTQPERVLSRTNATRTSHTRLATMAELDKLRERVEVSERFSQIERKRWRNIAGDPYVISRINMHGSWLAFCDELKALAVNNAGKSFQDPVKEKAATMFVALPVGEQLVYPREMTQISILIKRYSSTMARSIEARYKAVSPLDAVNESMKRVALTQPYKQVYSHQDVTILMLMETLFSEHEMQWMRHFVVFEDAVPMFMHRHVLHDYPMLVQVLNRWHVLFRKFVWKTDEPLLACYVWAYIVWFAFMGEVTLADRTYDLKLQIRCIFSSQYTVRFGGAAAPLDAPSNVLVHE